MQGYQLYYFTSCPYCIAVRMALWKMGVEIPLKNIKRNPVFLKELVEGGGKPQVPCLRIEDENNKVSWLYESADIVNYFRNQSFR